jgi:hypothetical protein
MTHLVSFTVPVETESGSEELWDVTAEIYREHGRYWFEAFEARYDDGIHDDDVFDDAECFSGYCVKVSAFKPDLIALACEALEAASTWRDDPDELAAAKADHEHDERRDCDDV